VILLFKTNTFASFGRANLKRNFTQFRNTNLLLASSHRFGILRSLETRICLLTSFVQIWHSLRVTYHQFASQTGLGQQKTFHLHNKETKGWLPRCHSYCTMPL